MKKVLYSIFALLAISTAPIATAATATTDSSEQPGKKTTQIILIKKSGNRDFKRLPAKPLYGYYDGTVLTLAIECSEANETATLRVSSSYSTTEYSFTVTELAQGVNIDLHEDDQIELILADGTTYNSL